VGQLALDRYLQVERERIRQRRLQVEYEDHMTSKAKKNITRVPPEMAQGGEVT
jgi:hypothetical protein